jgi:hypothetical protein
MRCCCVTGSRWCGGTGGVNSVDRASLTSAPQRGDRDAMRERLLAERDRARSHNRLPVRATFTPDFIQAARSAREHSDHLEQPPDARHNHHPRPGCRQLATSAGAVLEEEQAVLGFPAHLEFAGLADLAVSGRLADDTVAAVREALSNVARHASASKADVRVTMVGTLLTVEVVDDGHGIAETTTRSSGLTNMRKRAERHTGTFELSSPDGGGAHVCWTASTVTIDT